MMSPATTFLTLLNILAKTSRRHTTGMCLNGHVPNFSSILDCSFSVAVIPTGYFSLKGVLVISRFVPCFCFTTRKCVSMQPSRSFPARSMTQWMKASCNGGMDVSGNRFILHTIHINSSVDLACTWNISRHTTLFSPSTSTRTLSWCWFIHSLSQSHPYNNNANLFPKTNQVLPSDISQ